MAITQEVNIEMLEKLPDGNYKKKNPQTKASQVIANNGTTVEKHLADFDSHLAESTQQAHLAKNIGLEDAEGNFVATEVEGAMGELFTNVSNGKDLVSGAITGVDDSVVIPTDPTFQDLADRISQISTGMKYQAGTFTQLISGRGTFTQNINDLEFAPLYILVVAVGSSFYQDTGVFSNGIFYPSYGGDPIVRTINVTNNNISIVLHNANSSYTTYATEWLALG